MRRAIAEENKTPHLQKQKGKKEVTKIK